MNKRVINNFIFILMFLLCGLISIGYSSLSKTLSVSGDLAYKYGTDIRIINAVVNDTTNDGAITSNIAYNYNTISGGISLPNLNSTVKVQVTVKNFSQLDNEIDDLLNTTFSNTNITYTTSNLFN